MIDPITPAAGITDVLAQAGVLPAPPDRKAIDLAVIKRGAKDYLEFLDATKEVFYAYLYHRTGSVELARTIQEELYVDTLSRAMSLLWFGTLSMKLLFDAADEAIRGRETSASDIDKTYVANLAWLSAGEKQSVLTLHDALWSLPKDAQRLLILSILIGLPDSRIAEITGRPTAQVTQDIATAQSLLVERWQPQAELAAKMTSLVFVPSLDIQAETKLRFAVVEKYNALRFRRYQWVIIGGMFAIMSNVIVASVLAFAVIVQPPTSLRGTRGAVASLDATLLKRQLAVDAAKESVAASFKESQKLVAYSVSRDLTALGLASALESLKAQQDQESEVNKLLKLMERARTAMVQIVAMVWRELVN